jgi:hypothetical protein
MDAETQRLADLLCEERNRLLDLYDSGEYSAENWERFSRDLWQLSLVNIAQKLGTSQAALLRHYGDTWRTHNYFNRRTML